MKVKAILFTLVIPIVVSGQIHKKKLSNGAGTMFGYIGYMMSAYGESNINFVGDGYDFTLSDVRATDEVSYESFPDEVRPSIVLPEITIKAGYYFRNYWAFALGYDRMRYVMDDRNDVRINGAIDPLLVSNSPWYGIYNGAPTVTDRSTFHYENDELNFIKAEIIRTDMVYHVGYNNEFVITSNVGIGLGGIISRTDFNYEGIHNRGTVSFSGFGAMLTAGLRFEFFRHLFLQSNVHGGFHKQFNVQARHTETSGASMNHFYGVGSFDFSIGYLVYIRPINACDGCPIW